MPSVKDAVLAITLPDAEFFRRKSQKQCTKPIHDTFKQVHTVEIESLLYSNCLNNYYKALFCSGSRIAILMCLVFDQARAILFDLLS